MARRAGSTPRPLLDEGALSSWLPPSRVAPFAQVARLLTEATTLAADLRETEALARLGTAERLVREHADVPGAARWLAEVRTRVGVIALASSLDALGRSALGDAATLDPSRILGSAEAPPQVVEDARAIALNVASRPVGSFRVFGEGPFATVIIDDRPVGPAPARVVVPVGRHVLRVESRGYRPWGQVIDVLEGNAPDVHVRLSPGPELAARRALSQAASRGDAAGVRDALRQLPEDAQPNEVWLLELSRTRLDRALLTRCTRASCGAPQRLVPDRPALGERAAWSTESQRRAHAWLAAPPPPPPPRTPLYRRPGLWLGVGAAVIAASVTAIVLTRPEPRHTLVVEPRPGDL